MSSPNKNESKNRAVSIVIPCFNEEGNVITLYDRIRAILPSNVEFIFVDDHSSDKTVEVIESLAKKDKAVKFLSFSRNFGHQNALRAGLDYATGDCVISMDADLQHPPEVLRELLEKWEEGYDVVYTIRQDNDNISTFKKANASLFYTFMNKISDIQIKQGAADFRLLDRRIVNILINDITEYHLFYRGIVSWIGYRQVGIEYVPNKRYSGETAYSLSSMISFALSGITSFSIKPLELVMFLGIIISSLTGIYGIYVFGISIFTDEAVKGWTSVLLSILFIGGINMMLLGIVGEYVGKIYMQGKKRPYYLISKTNLGDE